MGGIGREREGGRERKTGDLLNITVSVLTFMSPSTFRAASSSLIPREKSGPGSHYIYKHQYMMKVKPLLYQWSHTQERMCRTAFGSDLLLMR